MNAAFLLLCRRCLPHCKAKPYVVHGCEIWMKLGGDAQEVEAGLTFLATDTHSLDGKINSSDAGKKAIYWLRWWWAKTNAGPLFDNDPASVVELS